MFDDENAIPVDDGQQTEDYSGTDESQYSDDSQQMDSGEVPTPQQVEDWQKRYNDLQPAFTKATQELAAIKPVYDALSALPEEVQKQIVEIATGQANPLQAQEQMNVVVGQLLQDRQVHLVEEVQKCQEVNQKFVEEHKDFIKTEQDLQKINAELQVLGWKGWQQSSLADMKKYPKLLEKAFVLAYKDELLNKKEKDTVNKIRSSNSVQFEKAGKVGTGSNLNVAKPKNVFEARQQLLAQMQSA